METHNDVDERRLRVEVGENQRPAKLRTKAGRIRLENVTPGDSRFEL